MTTNLWRWSRGNPYMHHFQGFNACFSKLHKYDYTIQYVPRKNMVLADRLSRFPSPHNNLPIELHQNIHALYFNSDRLHIINGAIERDPIHSAVYRMTLNGWPNRIQDVPHLACHFWSLKDKLTIKEGVLLKGNSLHSTWIIWQDPLLLTQQPPGHRKNEPYC